METLYMLATVVSIVVTVAVVAGVVISNMRGADRQAQERAINALSEEVASLTRKLDTMEDENKRLEQIILTICDALQKRGLDVSIEGHIVTVSDTTSSQTVRIQS